MFLCLALALREILAREFQKTKQKQKTQNNNKNLTKTNLFKLHSHSQSTSSIASNADCVSNPQKYFYSFHGHDTNR